MKIANQIFFVIAAAIMVSCNSGSEQVAATGSESSPAGRGQSGVQDETSAPNIVQVASGSKDHSTLVAAVLAAKLEDALSNAGPFTVFAPTNAAFEKLPPGTVEGLLKPENVKDLINILEYHTYVGNLKVEYMGHEQQYEQVNGGYIKITKEGDKTFVNGTEIVATITTANGLIHVINDVLLP